MYRTWWIRASLTLVLALMLVQGGLAQQQQQQRHHPGGTSASQEQPAGTRGETDDEDVEEAPMMQQMQDMMQQMRDMRRQMRGMMGGRMMGGGMMQRHLERLTQQLGLGDDQRTQVQTLVRNHAKEVIRLQADIAIMRIDVGQLLDADPVDLPKVKQLVQAIAAKEADLQLSHITVMQEIRKLLNPEQQKTFRTMQGHMMEDGGMMGHGGMRGPGGMMEGMMGRRGMMGRDMRGHGSRAQ